MSMHAENERPRRTGPGVGLWMVLGVAVAVLFLFWAARNSRNGGEGAESHPAVGRKVSVVELQPLTGEAEPVRLDDLQGKVSLINFWGPWCGPCVIEFPHLVELQQHYENREDFRFLSVSCSGGPGDDRAMEESTAAFLAQQEADFPTYRDAEGVTRDHLADVADTGGFVYPTTVLLGRNLEIRALWLGYQDGYEDEMRRLVAAELERKP